MNKITIVCAILVGLSINIFAGESCFQKDDNIVQAGLGLGMGGEGFPVGFAATYERGIHDLVSIGGSFGISGWKDEFPFNIGYLKVVSFPIVARGAFHPFNLPALADKIPIKNRLDVYGGIAMGWGILSSKWHWNKEYDGFLEAGSTDNSDFLFSVLVGARYYINDRFGFYLEETANSIGVFNVGATLKF